MPPFAKDTSVPVGKSRGEIETLVARHGAERFGSGWVRDQTAGISFVLAGRMVRFELPLPEIAEARAVIKAWAQYKYREPPESLLKTWVDKESRRRWRCLLLAIKAKLEVVASGIATFEEEFLAHIVVAGKLTVYETLKQHERAPSSLLPALDRTVESKLVEGRTG